MGLMSTGASPWEQFLAGQDPQLRALSEGPPPDYDMQVGDRTVPRAEFISVLAEQVSTALDDGRGLIRQDRRSAGILAGMATYRVRSSPGRDQLAVRGLEVEPQTNARVCFEHAVALQELALAADSDMLDAAMGQLAGDAGRHQKRQLDHLDQIDADTGNTNRSLLDAARKDHKLWPQPPGYSVRRIKDMFENVSPGGALYSAYSRLSEASHAGNRKHAGGRGRDVRERVGQVRTGARNDLRRPILVDDREAADKLTELFVGGVVRRVSGMARGRVVQFPEGLRWVCFPGSEASGRFGLPS